MDNRHYNPAVLKRCREDKGLKQTQVAKELGVTRLTINRAEKGYVASYDLLGRMTNLYGVPITIILRPHPLPEKILST